MIQVSSVLGYHSNPFPLKGGGMAQWLEHSPGVREVASSIPRYGNIGLCAPRQHIGLHAPRQHSCILPRELRTTEPIYAPWHMWVVCCNLAWSYRRGTLSSEAPCIWCSMQRQVKDTTQGVNVQPAVDSHKL